jgi:hypothetical protein
VPHNGAEVRDDVHDTRQESSFIDEGRDEQGGEGSNFGGFDDDCVACSEGGGDQANMPTANKIFTVVWDSRVRD